MRKVVLSLLFVAFVFSANAQEKGKIRVGVNAGLALPNSGVGIAGDLDIRYNVMDNVNVGVKFGLASLVKDMDINNPSGNIDATVGAATSTLLISDYYFSDGNSSFAPFLGGGLGFYNALNIKMVGTGSTAPTTPSDLSSFLPEKKFGGLLRGGFEAGHFRMSLEYYLIPKSTVVDINNVSMGKAGNSFLNATIGFYLGGGRWRKL